MTVNKTKIGYPTLIHSTLDTEHIKDEARRDLPALPAKVSSTLPDVKNAKKAGLSLRNKLNSLKQGRTNKIQPDSSAKPGPIPNKRKLVSPSTHRSAERADAGHSLASEPAKSQEPATKHAKHTEPEVIRTATTRWSMDSLESMDSIDSDDVTESQDSHSNLKQKVEVKVGCGQTVTGDEDLHTHGLSDCSAFVFLSKFDKEKNVYGERTLIHINGSSLKEGPPGLQGESAGSLICRLLDNNRSAHNKMIMVYGNSNTDYSPRMILPQDFNGRQPLQECINLCGKENVVHRRAAGVTVSADGSFTLLRPDENYSGPDEEYKA